MTGTVPKLIANHEKEMETGMPYLENSYAEQQVIHVQRPVN